MEKEAEAYGAQSRQLAAQKHPPDLTSGEPVYQAKKGRYPWDRATVHLFAQDKERLCPRDKSPLYA